MSDSTVAEGLRAKAEEQTIEYREALILEVCPEGHPGITEPSFKSLSVGGQIDYFAFEEVHPDERHLIAVHARFRIHHLYRIECGNKTRSQRVEFGLVRFPIEVS